MKTFYSSSFGLLVLKMAFRVLASYSAMYGLLFYSAVAIAGEELEASGGKARPSEMNSASPLRGEVVYIAGAQLDVVRDGGAFLQAVYKVDHVYYGGKLPDIVSILFYRNSLRGSVPTNAILVLGHDHANTGRFKAYGYDVSRSIFPRTPELLDKISGTTNYYGDLVAREELPSDVALNVAISEIRERVTWGENADHFEERYEGGWRILLWSTSNIPDQEITVTVSDDGTVMDVHSPP